MSRKKDMDKIVEFEDGVTVGAGRTKPSPAPTAGAVSRSRNCGAKIGESCRAPMDGLDCAECLHFDLNVKVNEGLERIRRAEAERDAARASLARAEGRLSAIVAALPPAEEVERLRRLDGEATPGPWKTCGASDDNCQCGLVWSLPADMSVAQTHTSDDGVALRSETNHDTRLIAAARNLTPALLAIVDAVRKDGGK